MHQARQTGREREPVGPRRQLDSPRPPAFINASAHTMGWICALRGVSGINCFWTSFLPRISEDVYLPIASGHGSRSHRLPREDATSQRGWQSSSWPAAAPHGATPRNAGKPPRGHGGLTAPVPLPQWQSAGLHWRFSTRLMGRKRPRFTRPQALERDPSRARERVERLQRAARVRKFDVSLLIL